MNNSTDNDMLEKIIKRLTSIIIDDPLLSEFSFIPTCGANVDKNICPVKYARSENCVGIETWCVKHVFKYAQYRIFKLRKIQNKCRDNIDALNMYLTGALLLLPEVTTFWNIRKELFLSGYLNETFELQLSALVLSHKCKSYESFTYRRWLLNRIKTNTSIVDKRQESLYYRNVFMREEDVLRRATVNTPNNYHAWNHRIWCFENIVLPYLPLALQVEEINFSEKWIKLHVSEHSGFHYRQHVLNRCKQHLLLPKELPALLIDFSLDKNSNFINTMLDSEYLDKIDQNDIHLYNQYIFVLIYELFNVLAVLHLNYPGHETIWYHRRFIMSHIYYTICEIYGIKDKQAVSIPLLNLPEDVNIVESSVNVAPVQNKSRRLLAIESTFLFKKLMDKEKSFLDNLIMNNKWSCDDDDFAYKYKKWMQCILDVNV